MKCIGDNMARMQEHAQQASIVPFSGRLVFCIAVLLLVGAAPVHAQSVYSKSNRFRIPFQFDQSELQRLGAEQIELFVSKNEGDRWGLVEAVEPTTDRFTFEANADGEYWFSVRTRTKSGLTYPAGPHQPGLQVIVDTTKPTLELTLSETEPGRVRLIWRAEDLHLDDGSLTLESQEDGSSNWDAVNVTSLGEGQTTWTIDKPGTVRVRGTIRDKAGNEITTQAQTRLSTGRRDPAATPDFSRPVANQGMSTDDIPDTIQNTSNNSNITANVGPMDPMAAMDIPSIPPPMSSVSSGHTLDTPMAPMPAPIASSTVSDMNPSSVIAPPRTNSTAAKPVSSSGLPTATQTLSQRSTIPTTDEPPLAPPATAPLTPTTSNPPLAPIPASPMLSPPPSSNLAATTPPSQRVQREGHLVNSNVFRVGYEVDNVGPSGVRSVELYITEDGGQRWFHYGSDPDRQSPFEVQVPQDGKYGFTFRVQNGVGAINTPPQPGERPDVIVTVDRVAPKAQLMPLQQGPGSMHSEVVINWTATDRELAEHPIALYYAPQQTGPWELIQGWTSNTGQFVWNVPSTVDKKLYVRLEVRDEAGNVTRVDGSQPFMIDRSKPRARVTDIESLKTQQN